MRGSGLPWTAAALLAGGLLCGCSSSGDAQRPAAAGTGAGTSAAGPPTDPTATSTTDPTATTGRTPTAPTASSPPLPTFRLPTIVAPPRGGTAPPTRPGSAPPTGTGSTGTLGLTGFRTPSGNIHCMLSHDDGEGDDARCMIGEATWAAPPKPADCDLDWGSSLSVGTRGGAGFDCYGDTVDDPGNLVLGYGQTSSLAGVRCTSRESGVTCTAAATGHGFELSRAAYRLF